MNPFTWKTRHLIAGGLCAVAGGAAGIVMGWANTPLSRAQGANTAAMLVAWLHFPQAWWPWALAGALAGALAYYAGDLLTGAR